MAYYTRLREARKQAKLTQEQLGNIIGCAKTTITGYETGKSEPSMAILSRIMDAVGVDANFIFQDEQQERQDVSATPQEMENIIRKYRRLNEQSKEFILYVLNHEMAKCNDTVSKGDSQKSVIPSNKKTVLLRISAQAASAGTGIYLGPDAFSHCKVSENSLTRRADFAVPVSGDSMEPQFHDGDIALVSADPAEDGDIVIAVLQGEGYIKKMGHGKLISLNPQYKPIRLDDSIHICGKVIGILDSDWIQ